MSDNLILDTLSAIPIWVSSPLVRPWHMRWGATNAEVAEACPAMKSFAEHSSTRQER